MCTMVESVVLQETKLYQVLQRYQQGHYLKSSEALDSLK